MVSRDPREVHRRLAEAALPYGLRAERTEFSLLPDLVLLRDNRPVARLRFMESERGDAYLRTVYPPYVSPAEEAEIEAHFQRRLATVILEVFSYTVWPLLPDMPSTSGSLGNARGSDEAGHPPGPGDAC